MLLAIADGDVSEKEIGALSTQLGSLFGDELPAVALGAMVDAELSRMGHLGLERYVKTLVDRLPQFRRAQALRGALTVAYADGLAPEEESMFRAVATELGLDAATADAMLAEIRAGASFSRGP